LGGANLTEANLGRAILGAADLKEVKLSGADLREANLREANLSGADLREADLSGANLGGAIVSYRQLRQAKSLEGAQMPKFLFLSKIASSLVDRPG
jgi:uncharacterized protein YjbI with pentapeptide repeats